MRRARPSFVLLLCSTLVLAATVLAPTAEAGRPSPLLLSPQAVVPGPGDPSAAGSFKWGGGRCGFDYLVTVNSLDGLITRIAIHRGAAGTSGPEVLRLCPSPIGLMELQGCVPIDRALLREIKGDPQGFYLEVTTTSFPSGAMRGQLRQ
jgi:hypothetical protein